MPDDLSAAARRGWRAAISAVAKALTETPPALTVSMAPRPDVGAFGPTAYITVDEAARVARRMWTEYQIPADGSDAARDLVREEFAADLEAAGSPLCDCDDADEPPTGRNDQRMAHHCECRAVVASIAVRRGRSLTLHARECGCESVERSIAAEAARG